VIAALFVETGGSYYGLPDVDPWDKARDARKYAGPHPVVAHPQIAAFSRLADDNQLVDDNGKPTDAFKAWCVGLTAKA
jgi:hypothetical protein